VKKMTWAEMDALWLQQRKEHSWNLPAPVHAFWRLPVIRWIRGAYNAWRVEQHYSKGFGTIGIRTGYDDWVIYAIFRGWY
jgi:hypothetical protein